MTLETRDSALNELAAPIGALMHSVNNALAVIATTTYALQIEQRLSDEDANAILGGIDAARLAFADFEPMARSRGKPEVAVQGPIGTELSSSVSALAGRAITVAWRVPPPRVADVTRSTRRLIAALWTAADELSTGALEVTAGVDHERVVVWVKAPDGRSWGPGAIGVPAAS